MARKFEGNSLLIATHNPGKLPEIMALLPDYIIDLRSSLEFGLPEPVEDGDSFLANARIKALDAAERSGMIALADDSGLCVTALDGWPAHLSARVAEQDGKRDFDKAGDKIVEMLIDKPDRSAYFVCVLTLAWADGHTEFVEGRVYGTIALQRRGDKGFGYDPIFIPDGYDKTFGEDPAPKDQISHRADAFRKLNEKCFRPTAASCTLG